MPTTSTSTPARRLAGAAVAAAVALVVGVLTFVGASPSAATPPTDGLLAATARLGSRDAVVTFAPDGTQLREVAIGTDPAWSPDGQWLAFVTPASSVALVDVATLGVTDTGVPAATSATTSAAGVAWSPSGDRLAYVVAEGDDLAVWVMDVAAPHDPHRVGTGFAPTWRPDGDRVAFSGPGEGGLDLFDVRTDGSRLRVLTATPGITEFGPAWRPTGGEIAFNRCDDPVDPCGYWSIAPDGTGLQLLRAEPVLGYQPVWSPSGRSLLIDGEDGLAVLDRASGEVAPLPTTLAVHDLAWGTRLPDPPGLVVEVGDVTVNEGDSGARVWIPVRLSLAAVTEVRVRYEVWSDSPVVPPASGTLVIRAHRVAAAVPVPVKGNTRRSLEGAHAQVVLLDAAGAQVGEPVGVLTVTGDDRGQSKGVTLSDATVSEGDRRKPGLVALTVRIPAPVVQPVTVGFTGPDGPSSVTIPAGRASAPLFVPAGGGNEPTGDQTVAVHLTSATGGLPIADGTGIVTVVDDD